jgi:hypothetical protein
MLYSPAMKRSEKPTSTDRRTTGPISESDQFDWRWVGEPESWMGLRSERAMAPPPTSATAAGEAPSGRLATRLARSFLSLFSG